MQPDLPLVRDLVLVGGGHTHALILRKWAMKPQPGVQVTVINPAPVAAYTGMLPGVVAGHYTRDEAMIDLVRLCRLAGARLVLGAVDHIDRTTRQLSIPGRHPLRYDVVSLDIGILAGPSAITGIGHAVPARPLDRFLAGWQTHLSRDLQDGRIVIIGGGVGGVELALAAAHRQRHIQPRIRTQPETQTGITILDAAQAMRALPGPAALRMRQALGAAGITLHEHVDIAEVRPDAVILQDGTRFASDLTIAVGGAVPHGWLAGLGLDVRDGFVTVGPTLQTSDPRIFAAGDCAHLSHAPRPKAGVFAVRAAPVLFHNLQSALSGTAMRRFQPQSDYLKLISLGGQRALLDRNGISFSHPALWRWKDRIDRKFMARLRDFPAMARPAVPDGAAEGLAEALGEKPLCGGCGAKVGAQSLQATLATLPETKRADVQSGPGDDAAILRTSQGFQLITTDHLRSFTSDPYLMARIAAIHALGDIWAMGARPQVALAQITLPRMADPMQTALLAEIMAGAAGVFNAAGADIVGGHTAIGAELTIGFSVTGLADHIITKRGAQPGDGLILTKPIGSGTVMAAEMAMAQVDGVVLGEAVAVALQSMQHPLGPASAVLSGVASAMTDVTGFGMAGHLMEMLQASGCAARLHLDAVPLLPGALALARAGYASSLAAANRAAVAGILADSPRPEIALLIDPQTAGGLLASVPAGQVELVLAQLHAAGETAALIGQIVAGEPTITCA